MAHAKFQCEVHAPFDVLWKILMDEVENPHAYNPKIHGARVLERFHDGILRVVAVPDADVRERVTYKYDKGEISSEIVGHPQLVGTIRKQVSPGKQSKDAPLTLTCELEWQSTSTNIDKMVRRNVESFVLNGLDQVRVRAEEIARG